MINLEQARGLLARAVMTQGPDFVYNLRDGDRFGCINVPVTEQMISNAHTFAGGKIDMGVAEDSPKRKTGCLVGTAMKLSGLVPEDQFPVEGAVDVFAQWLADRADQEPVSAGRYFAIAQTAQDDGNTWGEAYAAAEGALADLMVVDQ